MTNALAKLIQYCAEESTPMYLEHNDFLNGGISIDEELRDLILERNITNTMADEMMSKHSIWSLRVYHDEGEFFIVYHINPDAAAIDMLNLLGQHFGELND